MGASATIELRKRIPVATGKFPATLNACNILDKYEKQENVGKEKKQQVKINKALEGMQKAFREILEGYDEGHSGVQYRNACRQVESLAASYTAGDIRLFSMSLAQFQEKKGFDDSGGFFLSALMNKSKEKDFTIDTRNLSAGIFCIGYKNTKNITVDGNLGSAVGIQMKKGRITVNGDVGGWAGSGMAGGEIIVNGCAHSWGLCEKMTGGKITLNGDTKTIDSELKGGVVVVNGRIGELAKKIKGGDIYQYDRQLVKDGKKVAEPENK